MLPGVCITCTLDSTWDCQRVRNSTREAEPRVRAQVRKPNEWIWLPAANVPRYHPIVALSEGWSIAVEIHQRCHWTGLEICAVPGFDEIRMCSPLPDGRPSAAIAPGISSRYDQVAAIIQQRTPWWVLWMATFSLEREGKGNLLIVSFYQGLAILRVEWYQNLFDDFFF